jgi:hypothetical protein
VVRLWILVLAIVLVGCQASREAEADPMAYTLDRQFTVNGGQEAAITGENLRLRFTEVLEDSRCPTDVECFWTGQARIAVLVHPAGSPPVTVDFNTNPAPGQNAQTVQVGGYTIELKSLDPYPTTPDGGIAFDDYKATLLVRKA